MTENRVAVAGAGLVAALAAACDPSVGEDDAIAALRECAAVQRLVDFQLTRLIAVLDSRGVFADRGARTEDAVADIFCWDRGVARRRVAMARAVIAPIGPSGEVLAPRMAATASAFENGEVDAARVEAIRAALGGAAAARANPEDWAAVEKQLADYAANGARPADLRTVANQLIGLLDQDGPEPDPPPRHRSLRLVADPDRGGGWVRGELDASGFAAVATALDALSKPVAGAPRGLAQRQADALVDVCRFALDHAELPEVGGERPHLNVTVDLEDLENRARSGWLDFGGVPSPGELRMLACDAMVIPMVMRGRSEVLDLGRKVRAATAGMRRAAVARDRCCAFPGCGRPPAWCDLHHIKEWARDRGETSVDNVVLLCRVHHRMVHCSGWSVRMGDGGAEFIPPPWIDPSQTPRRRL